MPKNERSFLDTYPLSVEMIRALSPYYDIIDQINLSVEAIRERIDQAYNRICVDLPEIDLEMHQTFQLASGTLESLHAHGKTGKIESVARDIEGSIRNLALRIESVRSRDAHLLETIEHSYPDRESLLRTFEDPALRQGPDHGARTLALNLATERDNLVSIMRNALDIENSLIEETVSSMEHGAKSIKCTLSSAVEILRDLVSRSDSMKEPILKIMSGLQTHDIVNQDMAAVSYGLQKMSSLRDVPGNRDDVVDAVLFQEQASSLSRELISQLIKVVRRHGRELDQEIGRIEDTVSRIKEGKDAVGGFLLSCNGSSTLDIVISETSGIFTHIAGKLEALVLLKESLQERTDHLISLCHGFDERISSGTSVGPQREMPEVVSEKTFLLISLAKTIEHGHDALDLKEVSERFGREADAIKCDLEEIRAPLIGSIRGIDTCFCKCTDAIRAFRKDIDKLTKMLDGNEDIFDGLSSFALSLGSIRDGMFRRMGLDRCDISTREFNDILSMLKNPHSNSLASGQDHEMDEGLEIF